MKRVISILITLLMLASCQLSNKTPQEYVAFITDPQSGYHVHHKIGLHEYDIQLATPEYMVCQELLGKHATQEEFNARLGQIKSMVYFIIKMKTISASQDQALRPRTLSEADVAVGYYGQQAMQDIKLKAGDKMLSPAGYEYENNYGLSPHNTIVVAFDAGGAPADMLLTFDDQYRQVPALNSFFKKSLLSSAPGVLIK